MRSGRVPVIVAGVFLIAAMVAAFVIGTPPTSARGDTAVRAFLDEWQRSRLATFAIRSDFVRTLPDGNRFTSSTTTVQRPPDDRLITGLGSTSGRLQGRIVGCAGSPDGDPGCVLGAPAPDYRSEVAAEIAGLRSYLTGDRPLYRVVDFGGVDDHCFRLELAVDIPAPPYGNEALFCFDRATGAPVLTEIRRPEADDETVAREVRSDVGPEDLQIPSDRGAVIGVGPDH